METIRNLAAGEARPAASPAGPGEKEDYLKILRNLIFFIAIYLYFIGWIYIYYYLDNFGISLSSVDTPVYYFFVYSYTVLSNGIVWLLCVSLVAVTVLLLVHKYKHEVLKRWAVTILLVILFPISFYLAVHAGRRQAVMMRMGHAKPISFVMKKDVQDNYSDEFKQANKDSLLKLVFQTEDRFYALNQPLGEEKTLPIGSVFIVFKSDVQMAKIDLLDTPLKEK